jgi:hypothetical protein
MSPRKNRRTGDMTRETGRGAFGGPQRIEEGPDGDWIVRPAAGADKAYRCPGCDQEIRPGTAHVVVWPADERGDLTDRRHWHSGCWRARDRRAPGVLRSRGAPRYG